MTVAPPVEKGTKQIIAPQLRDDSLVTVALRRDVIARLKQINEDYVRENSLDDALDRVIALAADTYRQKNKLGLDIDSPQQLINEADTDFIEVKLRRLSVSHLKWLDEKYIKAKNLGETLEIVIALAEFIYEQRAEGIIKIQRKSDTSLRSGNQPFRLKRIKPSFRQRVASFIAR
jgi:hypothetical protein